jgi:hypothetical protein
VYLLTTDCYIWTTALKNRFETLKADCIETKKFDDALCLVQNDGKGVVCCSHPADVAKATAELSWIGSVRDQLEYLGIEYSIQVVKSGTPRSFAVKQARMTKTERRLKRIAAVGTSLRSRMGVICKTVIPISRWGGQWRTNNQEKDPRIKFERCLIGKSKNLWCGRSPALI